MNPQPGVCRYCGCTELNPCKLYTGGGDTCAWDNDERTVCSSPRCMIAEDRRKKAARAAAKAARAAEKARYSGMGYGLIVKTMRREERQACRARRKRGIS